MAAEVRGTCGHQPRSREPLGAGKGKEMDSSLGPPKGRQPADTLVWAYWGWFWTSGLHSCSMTSLHCFKPPSLWWLVTAAAGDLYTTHQHSWLLVGMLFLKAIFLSGAFTVTNSAPWWKPRGKRGQRAEKACRVGQGGTCGPRTWDSGKNEAPVQIQTLPYCQAGECICWGLWSDSFLTGRFYSNWN